MTEHTPEPWLISAFARRNGHVHLTKTGTLIADFVSANDGKRAQACVNGCAGIPTKALQNGIIQAMRQTILLAEHNRSGENDTNDEGLKALRRMAGLLRTRSDGRCAVCPLAYESTAPCACYETAPTARQ